MWDLEGFLLFGCVKNCLEAALGSDVKDTELYISMGRNVRKGEQGAISFVSAINFMDGGGKLF